MRDRQALVAIATACVAIGPGCAYSILDNGRVRPSELDRIAEATMEARGLRTERPIAPQVVAQADLHRILEDALRTDWSPEEIEKTERGMVAMGLWPPNLDLLAVYLDVLSQEVAGLYVPQSRTLYLVGDFHAPFSLRLLQGIARRDLMRELVLSHEIIHLLQDDAYPGLLASDAFLRAQDDLAYAIQASFEGDATHYGLRALGIAEADLPDPNALRDSMQSTADERPDAPPLLRRTLVFPYAEGYPLSLAEGGALLERPPISTEQVMHGDRRFEPPLAFDLRPLDALLPEGCERLVENTVGELALSVLFEAAGQPADPAAWEGWGGDRYLVVDCPGGPEFVWATAWDTESDAREFALAYAGVATWLASRRSDGAPPSLERRGSEVWIATSGLGSVVGAMAHLVRPRPVSSIEDLRALHGGAGEPSPAMPLPVPRPRSRLTPARAGS